MSSNNKNLPFHLFPLVSDQIINISTSSIESGKQNTREKLFFSFDNSKEKESTRSLTSLARIIARIDVSISQRPSNGVCGCLYINKESEVVFTTNISPKDVDEQKFSSNFKELTDLFNSLDSLYFFERSFLNLKRNRLCDKSIVFNENKVRMFATTNRLFFTQKDNEVVNVHKKVHEDFYLYNTKLEKEVNGFKNSEKELRENKAGEILKHYHELQSFLFEYISNFEGDQHKQFHQKEAGFRLHKNFILSQVKPILLHIEDFLNLYSLYKNDHMVKKLLINKKVKRASCNGKPNVHCEMRMLESITAYYDNCEISEETWKTISEDLREGNLVVSKICCANCYPVFAKLEELVDMDSSCVDKYLGHSGSLFKGWKSPFFCRENLFDNLKKEVENEFENISKKERYENSVGLENSLTEFTINKIENIATKELRRDSSWQEGRYLDQIIQTNS